MSLFFARKREKISPEARRAMARGDEMVIVEMEPQCIYEGCPEEDEPSLWSRCATFFDDRPALSGGLLGASIALAIWLPLWVLFSAGEAAAYRRVTGKSVSTLDAMFLDLRVQEAVK